MVRLARRGAVAALSGAWLGGCAVLFPASPPATFDLTVPEHVAARQAVPRGVLVVPVPIAVQLLDTERMLARSPGAQVGYVADAQWSGKLTELMQARIVQSLENAGRLRAVGRPGDRLTPDYQLLTEIRAFELVDEGAGARAVGEIAVKISGERTGRVVAARVFKVERPAAGINGPAAAQALNEVLAELLRELVGWTSTRV